MKFAALGAVAGVLTSVIGDTATQIAVLAAGAAGAGYLFRHVLLPAAQLLRRALAAWEILDALAPWMRRVDDRLSHLESQASTAEVIAREVIAEHRNPPDE